MEVVRIARMVPMGMERWASFRSPDRLEPAIIPEGKSIKKNRVSFAARAFQEERMTEKQECVYL